MSKSRQLSNTPNRLSVAYRAELLATVGSRQGEMVHQADIGLTYTWNVETLLWEPSGTGAIETINDFDLADTIDGSVLIVKDENRGGTFVYDSSAVGGDNQGTNFHGWVRQYSGAVRAEWFGADNTGVADAGVVFNSMITTGFIDIDVTNATFRISSSVFLDNYVKIRGSISTTRFNIDSGVYGFVGSTSFLYFLEISNMIIVGGEIQLDIGNAHNSLFENLDCRDATTCTISHVTGEKNIYRNITYRANNAVSQYGMVFSDETVTSLSITVDPTRGAWFDRGIIEGINLETATGSLRSGLIMSGDNRQCTLRSITFHGIDGTCFDVGGHFEYSTAEVFTLDGCGSSTAILIDLSADIRGSRFSQWDIISNNEWEKCIYMTSTQHHTTFQGILGATGDNVSKFGFYLEAATGYNAVFLNCAGAFYSPGVYYKTSQNNMINCRFSPSSVDSSHILSNTVGTDISVNLSANATGTDETNIGNFLVGVGRSGSLSNVLQVNNDKVKINGGGWSYRPFVMGAYYLWIDANGVLRIKSGAPTSDTDGTIVGTQA